jgi:membrane-associated phospholipid phosphatase
LSYAGVYPLVPIALAVHLAYVANADASTFWTVVLVTDYICFGTMPWIQARPPRAIEPDAPWRSRVRPFNRGLLHAASIQVNTFPSGHAAEAFAAALLVIGAPTALVALMFVAAIAVSAGAVLGRYHYALDAILGWAVAVAVWVAVQATRP